MAIIENIRVQGTVTLFCEVSVSTCVCVCVYACMLPAMPPWNLRADLLRRMLFYSLRECPAGTKGLSYIQPEFMLCLLTC